MIGLDTKGLTKMKPNHQLKYPRSTCLLYLAEAPKLQWRLPVWPRPRLSIIFRSNWSSGCTSDLLTRHRRLNALVAEWSHIFTITKWSPAKVSQMKLKLLITTKSVQKNDVRMLSGVHVSFAHLWAEGVKLAVVSMLLLVVAVPGFPSVLLACRLMGSVQDRPLHLSNCNTWSPLLWSHTGSTLRQHLGLLSSSSSSFLLSAGGI